MLFRRWSPSPRSTKTTFLSTNRTLQTQQHTKLPDCLVDSFQSKLDAQFLPIQRWGQQATLVLYDNKNCFQDVLYIQDSCHTTIWIWIWPNDMKLCKDNWVQNIPSSPLDILPDIKPTMIITEQANMHILAFFCSFYKKIWVLWSFSKYMETG